MRNPYHGDPADGELTDLPETLAQTEGYLQSFRPRQPQLDLAAIQRCASATAAAVVNRVSVTGISKAHLIYAVAASWLCGIAMGASALYFAAMRHGDRMYIGPLVMAGVMRVDDYVLMADPSAELGAVAAALARESGMGAGQGTADIALVLIGLLGLTAAALFVTTAPRYRRRRTRDALVEVATLENRLAENPLAGEREELERRRDQLRSRLAPTT
jgi:hypothetical protein